MSLFPKFVIETIPPAKVANPAKPNPNLSNFSKFSRGGQIKNNVDVAGGPCCDFLPRPVPFANLEKEYHDLLTRYWSPEGEELPVEELQAMLARLDALFQELTRQGRRVPVLTEEGRAYLRENTTELAA